MIWVIWRMTVRNVSNSFSIMAMKLHTSVWLENLKSDWGCLTLFLRFLHPSRAQVSISSISSTLAQSQEWRQSLSSLRLMVRKEIREVLKHKMEWIRKLEMSKLMLAIGRGHSWKLPCAPCVLFCSTPFRCLKKADLECMEGYCSLQHRRSPWSPQLWWCLWAKGFNGNMAWHICGVPTLELWMHTPCRPPSCHVDAGRK